MWDKIISTISCVGLVSLVSENVTSVGLLVAAFVGLVLSLLLPKIQRD